MMFILHGTFSISKQKFILWAEQDKQEATKQKKSPKLHPFCLPADQLASWMLETTPHLSISSSTNLIWLPSDGNQPQPSPELAATGAISALDDQNRILTVWKVDCVELFILDAVDFLLALGSRASTVVGSDIQFWRRLTLYGLSLVAAQQVIPALEKTDAQLRALWKPEQADHLLDWIQALPPASRALSKTIEEAPTPGALVNGWLERIVDQVVRQAVDGLSLPRPTTPGGKWIKALIGSDPIIDLKVAEANQLYKDWQVWVGQSDIAGTTAFKIAFRLDAPEDGGSGDSWTLDYLLQATDDPSLIVTAGQVWREKGKSLGYLHQRLDQPQERLLAGLGFAARVFPPIEQSLHSATPEQAILTTDEAYRFLKEAALLLQNSGFRVMLPRW